MTPSLLVGTVPDRVPYSPGGRNGSGGPTSAGRRSHRRAAIAGCRFFVYFVYFVCRVDISRALRHRAAHRCADRMSEDFGIRWIHRIGAETLPVVGTVDESKGPRWSMTSRTLRLWLAVLHAALIIMVAHNFARFWPKHSTQESNNRGGMDSTWTWNGKWIGYYRLKDIRF